MSLSFLVLNLDNQAYKNKIKPAPAVLGQTLIKFHLVIKG